jgi:arginyl-tRNA synthetase
LQGGRPGYVALWRHFVAVSRRSLEADFEGLDVRFDLWLGESSVHDRVAGIVERLRAAGHAAESQGALVVDVAEPTDASEVPPLMLVKGDGAFTYGATDLATIDDRVRTWHPDAILYVVDQRQHLHFEQVFRGARRTGIATDCSLEHIGFGTVNGKDGKPFKTRAGGVMKLGDLIAMARDEVRKRLDEADLSRDADEATRDDIVSKVGVAAIKFADLVNNRRSDYVFDLAKFTSFDGKTGPYLLYAAVRINSLLAKCAAEGLAPGTILPPSNDAERSLMLVMSLMPDALEDAWRGRTPHILCEWAHGLAQEFHRFYQACPVIREMDADRRASRMGLAVLTLAQLRVVFEALGLSVPRAM